MLQHKHGSEGAPGGVGQHIVSLKPRRANLQQGTAHQNAVAVVGHGGEGASGHGTFGGYGT